MFRKKILFFVIFLFSCSSLTNVKKIYIEQNDEQKIKIFFVLKHGFRITGTVLLIAHLLS